MDSSDMNRLLAAHHYSPADLEQVSDLCRNYPMFNLAHMLKVRIREALGQEKDPDLKVAAIYAGDRRKLFQMVTEVSKPEVFEEEPVDEEPEGIRFSDEPHQEADVIIEQHAPYAGPERSDDLLELDEEETEDSFMLDPEAEEISSETEEISSETLIEALAKDEVEMEDPEMVDEETPAIDMVEPKSEPEPGPGPELEPEPEMRSNERLILNFINEEPGPIRADKKMGVREDASLSSIREHDGFITDTLAKIYVKQGLFAKAIYAYEKLSLKYPEKSAYFAAQIEKIRNINRS